MSFRPRPLGAERRILAVRRQVPIALLGVMLPLLGAGGCSSQEVGYFRTTGTEDPRHILKRSEVYRSEDAWAFCASNLRVLSVWPFSPEAAAVGPAVCVFWKHPVKERTCRVGDGCEVFVFQFFQPGRRVGQAAVGIVHVAPVEGSKVMVSFSCETVEVHPVDATDSRPAPRRQHEGRFLCDLAHPRPFEALSMPVRRVLNRDREP